MDAILLLKNSIIHGVALATQNISASVSPSFLFLSQFTRF
jgi:hypothetical protein